jgi:hypothetical protein
VSKGSYLCQKRPIRDLLKCQKGASCVERDLLVGKETF